MMKKLSLLSISLLATIMSNAHTVNYILDKKTSGDIFTSYVQIGFEHILPKGLDHILFIVCVFFLSKDLKTIAKQATLFTLAHSITLALVACNIIIAPSSIIEPLIALSIAILAAENIFNKGSLSRHHYILIFAFGLLHGMGFASALSELGLPSYDFTNALISFNIGVELGQLSIICALYFGLQLIFQHKKYYQSHIVYPTNIAIGLVALYWTATRIIDVL